MRRSILLLTLTGLVTTVTAPMANATSLSSPLDGRWKTTHPPTTQQLRAAGDVTAGALARLRIKTPAMEYRAGHFRWFDLATGKNVVTGTYVVRGNTVRFHESWITPSLGQPGDRWLRWSVYRDRLTFSALPGRGTIPELTLASWQRVH